MPHLIDGPTLQIPASASGTRGRVALSYSSSAALHVAAVAKAPSSPYTCCGPSVYVSADPGSTWSLVTTLPLPAGADYNYGGGALVLSGSVMCVREYGAAGSAVYTYTPTDPADPSTAWAERSTLTTPAGTTPHQTFGGVMSLSGDLLAVGCELCSSTGRVFIFKATAASLASGGAWELKHTITSRRVTSVAVDVVAATGEARLAVGVASWDEVYVYTSTDYDAWTLAATLAGSAREFFGGSVALRGGLLAVGTPRNDATGTWHGTVYVFTASEDLGGASTWTQRAHVTPSDAASFTQYTETMAVGPGNMVVVGKSPDFQVSAKPIVIAPAVPTDPTSEWSQILTLTQPGHVVAATEHAAIVADHATTGIVSLLLPVQPAQWFDLPQRAEAAPSSTLHYGRYEAIAGSGDLAVLGGDGLISVVQRGSGGTGAWEWVATMSGLGVDAIGSRVAMHATTIFASDHEYCFDSCTAWSSELSRVRVLTPVDSNDLTSGWAVTATLPQACITNCGKQSWIEGYSLSASATADGTTFVVVGSVRSYQGSNSDATRVTLYTSPWTTGLALVGLAPYDTDRVAVAAAPSYVAVCCDSSFTVLLFATTTGAVSGPWSQVQSLSVLTSTTGHIGYLRMAASDALFAVTKDADTSQSAHTDTTDATMCIYAPDVPGQAVGVWNEVACLGTTDTKRLAGGIAVAEDGSAVAVTSYEQLDTGAPAVYVYEPVDERMPGQSTWVQRGKYVFAHVVLRLWHAMRGMSVAVAPI